MPSRGTFSALVTASYLVLGGCEAPGTYAFQSASLPPDAVVGAGDPTRAAVISSRSAFTGAQRLAPAQAARAVAQMEFLAATLPNNPTLRSNPPTLQPQMDIARREWRGVLGIPQQVPPQPVIDALYTAARALDAGQAGAAAAALGPPVFPAGGAATLARLGALPPLPATAAAAATAQQALVEPRPSEHRHF